MNTVSKTSTLYTNQEQILASQYKGARLLKVEAKIADGEIADSSARCFIVGCPNVGMKCGRVNVAITIDRRTANKQINITKLTMKAYYCVEHFEVVSKEVVMNNGMNYESVKSHDYHVDGPLNIKFGQERTFYGNDNKVIGVVKQNEVAKIIDRTGKLLGDNGFEIVVEVESGYRFDTYISEFHLTMPRRDVVTMA